MASLIFTACRDDLGENDQVSQHLGKPLMGYRQKAPEIHKAKVYDKTAFFGDREV